MLYTEENVRDNLRNHQGKRVFYLGKGHQLTSGARDFLARERIEILPAEQARPQVYRLPDGSTLTEKPEHMTHLHGDILVSKTHPRIAFRGAIDTLEAELLLCQLHCKTLSNQLEEILALARLLIRCDVLNEPVNQTKLCGLTTEELRSHSHRPQDFYGQPHFMPTAADGEALLQINHARCACRSAELAAAHAFLDRDGVPTRPDILLALNRMSSMLYLLMIRLKAGK